MLPNIWKGNLDQLWQEVKNLNVTHEDVRSSKRLSKKMRDDLLSEYYSDKKKMDL